MSTTVTLDKAGRIVLPKAVRDELSLAPGDALDLTLTGDQLTLRLRRTSTPLQKERGVWIYRIGEPLTIDETRDAVLKIRERRDRRNLGP